MFIIKKKDFVDKVKEAIIEAESSGVEIEAIGIEDEDIDELYHSTLTNKYQWVKELKSGEHKRTLLGYPIVYKGPSKWKR